VGQLSGTAHGFQTVGKGRDRLEYYGAFKAIRTSAARFVHGSVETQLQRKVGGSSRSFQRIPEIVLPLDGVDDHERYAVFMRGFGVEEHISLLQFVDPGDWNESDIFRAPWDGNSGGTVGQKDAYRYRTELPPMAL